MLVDKEVQTTIQKNCYPEVQVKLNSKEDKVFCSLLEYTPFQDIQENSERTINLPRKKDDAFGSISMSRLRLTNCLLLDDDALSELCLELRERIRKGLHGKLTTFEDKDTQTNLHVQPHILKDEEVASVVLDTQVQTEVNTRGSSSSRQKPQKTVHGKRPASNKND